MKTVLPLGKDPPAITSLSFNHNGKILAASATDGMIHMFGILIIIFIIIMGPFINCRTMFLSSDISGSLRRRLPGTYWACK